MSENYYACHDDDYIQYLKSIIRKRSAQQVLLEEELDCVSQELADTQNQCDELRAELTEMHDRVELLEGVAVIESGTVVRIHVELCDALDRIKRLEGANRDARRLLKKACEDGA